MDVPKIRIMTVSCIQQVWNCFGFFGADFDGLVLVVLYMMMDVCVEWRCGYTICLEDV